MAYRILHISDLHLGKNLHGFSLKEDQRYALDQVLHVIDTRDITTLLIAGDIFDRTDPPEYALDLFDYFLTELVDRNIQTVVISGNHDSRRRLSYAADLLKRCGVHIVTSYSGAREPLVLTKRIQPQHVSLADKKVTALQKGMTAQEDLASQKDIATQKHSASQEDMATQEDTMRVNIWPVPFLYPADVKLQVSDAAHLTTQQMCAFVKDEIVSHQEFQGAVNILMMHQSVAGSSAPPELSDSERHDYGYLGTVEFVESSLFEDFDYVALGHIHRPQQVGSPLIRYSGSLCMYSFSEMNYPKSAVMLEVAPRCSSREPSEASGGAPHASQAKDCKGGQALRVINTSCKHCDASLSVTTVPIAQRKPLIHLTGTLAELVERARTEREEDRNAYVKVTLTDNDEPVGALETLRLWYPSVMLLEYDNARTRALTTPVSLETPEALTKDLFELFEQFYVQQNGDTLDDKKARVVREALRDDHELERGSL